MNCPNCNHEQQQEARECPRCGLILAKWRGPRPTAPPPSLHLHRPTLGSAAWVKLIVALLVVAAAVLNYGRLKESRQEGLRSAPDNKPTAQNGASPTADDGKQRQQKLAQRLQPLLD